MPDFSQYNITHWPSMSSSQQLSSPVINASQLMINLLFSQRFCEKRLPVFCQRFVVFDAKMGKAGKKAKAGCQAIDS